MGTGDGYLLEATDYVIRKGSILSQRPGLTRFSGRGFLNSASTTPVLWNMLALFNKQTTSGVDAVVGVAVSPTNSNHYFVDQLDTVDGLAKMGNYRRNYWGYGAFMPNYNDVNAQDLGGMVMGDPRIVNGIYTTQNGPGRLLKEKQFFSETDDVNSGFDMYGLPLGIPSISNVTASVFKTANDSGIGATSTGITTFSYRAAYKLGGFFGAPSPSCQVQLAALPRITSLVVASNTMTVTTSAAHGLVAGDYFEILDAVNVDSTQPINKSWIVGSVTNATTWTVNVGSSTPATNQSPAAGINWKMRQEIAVSVARPKEARWVPTTPVFGPNDYRTGEGATNLFPAFANGEVFLYRTNMVVAGQGVPAINPGDEHFLVGNYTTKSSNPSPKAGWSDAAPAMDGVKYSDRLANIALGSNLYTNLSAETIAKQNTMPPVARVHEEYENYHFWANVKESAILQFRFTKGFSGRVYLGYQTTPLRGTGVMTWFCFEATGTENAAAMEFLNGATGTTDEQQAAIMARSLVNMINNLRALPFKARYVSDFGQSAGRVEVVAMDYLATNLSIASSFLGGDAANANNTAYIDTNMAIVSDTINLSAITPAAKNTGAATVIKCSHQIAERLENRIYYSKLQQAYATPRVNFLDLPKGVSIIAMRATAQNLYVVTDSGLWAITGTSDSSFNLRKKDNSVKAWSQGAVNLLRDQLFILTEQGVQVYGNGQTITSDISSLINPIREQVKSTSVLWDDVVGEPWISSFVDATNDEYGLIIPKNDGSGNHVLRYNLDTGAWTILDRDITCGMLYSSNDYNRMLMADRQKKHLVVERRRDDRFVNTDEMLPIAPGSFNNEIRLANGTYTYRGVLAESLYDDVNGMIRRDDHVAVVEYRADGKVYRTSWIRLIGVSKDANGWLFNTEKKLPTATTGVRYTNWNVTEPTTIKLSLAFNVKSRATLMTFRGGDANAQKRFNEILLHFVDEGIRELSLETLTDDRKSPRITKINRVNPKDGWGKVPWGQFAWGMGTEDAEPTHRTYVPVEHSVSRTLRVTIENTGFNQPVKIQGAGVMFTNIGQRTVR
jgi:hypothetical protein